jgi:signal transduction histidine kinase
MTKPWLGLLAAGPMSPALFRISNLHLHVGPVASASLRVASRLANRLKAGTASHAESLQSAELVFITGPEAAFPELLHIAVSSGIEWRGRTAVLLDFRRDASDLAPLRDLGASVGTLDSVAAFADSRFVADADDSARRRLRRFATATESSVFYLASGRKQVFAAGAAFTGTLFTPLVAATVELLKKAGLTQSEAVLIAERNTLQTLRSWLKSGRKGWTGSIPDGDLGAVRRQLHALNGENEVLSEYFANTARLALLLFGQDAGWLDALEAGAATMIETLEDPEAQRLKAAGRMAANLAHDWNFTLTLLAAQTAEIAHSFPRNHPAQAMTADLSRTIKHAGDSPRRLLKWLQEQPSKRLPADLNDAVRAALPLIQLALGRGVQCLTRLAETPLPLLLDQPLLLNALLNLASNASASMSGRGRFSILTSADENSISLAVEDTGRGMDDETRRRISEPSFGTRRSGRAHGLGLETVKSFAESHNATIAIESAPGQGCRFTLKMVSTGLDF